MLVSLLQNLLDIGKAEAQLACLTDELETYQRLLIEALVVVDGIAPSRDQALAGVMANGSAVTFPSRASSATFIASSPGDQEWRREHSAALKVCRQPMFRE